MAAKKIDKCIAGFSMLLILMVMLLIINDRYKKTNNPAGANTEKPKQRTGEKIKASK